MNFTLLHSLEHLALTTIAITLWNKDDIKASINELHFPLDELEIKEQWQELEVKVMAKVALLSYPKSLKKKVLDFIRPIGMEIMKWMHYHRRLNIYTKYPDDLCWVSQGIVNGKKSAGALIKDESLDVNERYILSCIYCCEDDILQLWSKIPENRRKELFTTENILIMNYLVVCKHKLFYIKQMELVRFWTYLLGGEMTKIDDMINRSLIKRSISRCSPYQYAFDCAAHAGNKVAAGYFLNKLTPEERRESLVLLAVPKHLRTTGSSDVLCFLLFHMNEKEIEMFKTCSYYVLRCLLGWPLQSLFLETANRMWEFLSLYEYLYLFESIVKMVKEGYKDCSYKYLFTEFWKQSPNRFKKFVICSCFDYYSPLKHLFDANDLDNVSLVLKTATRAEREEIVFSVCGDDITEDLVDRNDWDSLKFFIRECITSKKRMIKFKKKFRYSVKYSLLKYKVAKNKDKWNTFFQLLDHFIIEYGKRKCVESDGTPTKKPCL